jgi:hypothetical protein
MGHAVYVHTVKMSDVITKSGMYCAPGMKICARFNGRFMLKKKFPVKHFFINFNGMNSWFIFVQCTDGSTADTVMRDTTSSPSAFSIESAGKLCSITCTLILFLCPAVTIQGNIIHFTQSTQVDFRQVCIILQ